MSQEGSIYWGHVGTQAQKHDFHDLLWPVKWALQSLQSPVFQNKNMQWVLLDVFEGTASTARSGDLKLKSLYFAWPWIFGPNFMHSDNSASLRERSKTYPRASHRVQYRPMSALEHCGALGANLGVTGVAKVMDFYLFWPCDIVFDVSVLLYDIMDDYVCSRSMCNGVMAHLGTTGEVCVSECVLCRVYFYAWPTRHTDTAHTMLFCMMYSINMSYLCVNSSAPNHLQSMKSSSRLCDEAYLKAVKHYPLHSGESLLCEELMIDVTFNGKLYQVNVGDLIDKQFRRKAQVSLLITRIYCNIFGRQLKSKNMCYLTTGTHILNQNDYVLLDDESISNTIFTFKITCLGLMGGADKSGITLKSGKILGNPKL
jgi:hypothetical protein